MESLQLAVFRGRMGKTIPWRHNGNVEQQKLVNAAIKEPPELLHDSDVLLRDYCIKLEERNRALEERDRAREEHVLKLEETIQELKKPKPLPKRLSLDIIRAEICGEFNLRPWELPMKQRNEHIVFPRQVTMYLAVLLLPWLSMAQIGRMMGGFDHTTVMHSRNKVDALRKEDALVDQRLSTIQQKLAAMVAS
jgi:Bacterial dnaA protein helix-turn-helix